MDAFRFFSITLFFMLFSSETFAKKCPDHPVLEAYEATSEDKDWLSGLNEEEKQFLKQIYSIVEGAAIDASSTAVNNPVPTDLLTNAGNFKKIYDGDNLGGSLGIYSGIIGKVNSSLGDSLANMWKGSIDGLSGKGDSFAVREDKKNRVQVNQSLSNSGCDSLDEYEEPYYSQTSGLCGFANLGSLINFSPYIIDTESSEATECALEAHYSANSSTNLLDVTLSIGIKGSDEEAAQALSDAAASLGRPIVNNGEYLEVRFDSDYFAAAYYLHHNMIVAIAGARLPTPISGNETLAIANRVFPKFKTNQ